MLGIDPTVWKLILSVTLGAGIGSIVATRITFWQLSRRGFDLEKLLNTLESINGILTEWDNFANSTEGEYLSKRIVDIIDGSANAVKLIENSNSIIGGVVNGRRKTGKD